MIADSSPLNPLGFNYTKDFWEYFPNYDAWILKDSMPIASSDMSAFAINDRGYFCNGYNNDKNTFYKTIYEYTPDTLSYVNGAELIEKNSIFNKIILYPNPCNDKLLINSNNYLLNSIEITDMLGRNKTLIFQCKNQTEIIVDVSTLPKGIYFLKITDFNNQPTFKQFVKQ